MYSHAAAEVYNLSYYTSQEQENNGYSESNILSHYTQDAAADSNGFRHLANAIPDKSDVGCFHSHLCARSAHGNADIGGSYGWGIVGCRRRPWQPYVQPLAAGEQQQLSVQATARLALPRSPAPALPAVLHLGCRR